MSEFIGARISLISKSDIRYIGTLHEINSESSTVALENVVSYGTEGRKGNPNEEIAGSDQNYEYIVFRGSDVKELTIVEPPKEPEKEKERPRVPDDPAILGSARPPPHQFQQQHQPPNQQFQQQQNQQLRGPPPPGQFGGQPPQYGYPPGPSNQFNQPPSFQGPGGPHGFPGQPGAVPGYGMPYGPPPGYGPPYGPPPGHFQGGPPGPFPPQQQGFGPPGQRPPQQMQQVQQRGPPQQVPIGSNNGTPQPQGIRQLPPPVLETQKPVEIGTTSAPPSAATASGPPPPVQTKPSPAAVLAPSAAAPASAPRGPRKDGRVAIPLPSPRPAALAVAKPPQAKVGNATAPGPPQQTTAVEQKAQQSYADATHAATAAVAAAMAKLGQPSTLPLPRLAAGGMDNLTDKVSQMRMADTSVPRGHGRGRGLPRGERGGRPPIVKKEVPKEDFDFDASNAKFNKQDLVKEAIASGSPIASPTVETPVNGNNGVTMNGDHVEIPKTTTGYSKSKSFFDDISSDLKERTEQQQQDMTFDGRAHRREERSRNMETFGQGSVDSGYRGGYRGRGRGRGFGRGHGGFEGRSGGFEGRGGGQEGRGGYRGRGRGAA